MSETATADVAVVGGGIAGLWILDRLIEAGFAAVLLERAALGSGQTIASQGIIHGGAKYEVESEGATAAASISAMPARWRAALAGRQLPDLSAARILTERHLMFTRGLGLRAEIASRLVAARRERLERADWPAPLALVPQIRRVMALDEPVVDVPSVLRAFAVRHKSRLHRAEVQSIAETGEGVRLVLQGPRGRPGTLAARFCIVAAGAHTAELVEGTEQQLRPLHMAMALGAPGALFAHLLVGPLRPRFTVTSHPLDDGLVWYLGGGIAERGVAWTPGELIRRARAELARTFGDAAVAALRFATLRITRAEGAMPGKRRPDGAVLQPKGRRLALWPTKLALAPVAAEQALAWLREHGASGRTLPLALGDWPAPDVAHTPWQDIEQWN